ncbi:hypothetical protein EIP91_006492 [Steccherinum ochraceum]|uniref:Phospholipid/glycerol acyltransferase domain-containing protein n=1 Tax=Steccherinum ochraceum TaxID=92696 RepID=A0A4R0RTH9_9APHY|nr:hypothetical protein EIP91_006492 [Steccherinum ochraceum]
MSIFSASASDIAYVLTIYFWRLITGIFFREVRPRGAFNIPKDGPVIFVAAPHHNQFLDLLLALEVYRESGRTVQFLVAAKSMTMNIIGPFARLLRSIPVRRAQDETQAGTGKICLSPDDPCLVLGENTHFTSEIKPRMSILLPKSVSSLSAEVVEVISETQLRVKKEFGNDKGTNTALVQEKLEASHGRGLDFKIMPSIKQDDMYRHVYECMRAGGSIGIFPEGNHDRTDLLPLKAGACIMAMGTMANHPEVNVKIVPVGMSYFHAHRFRSRAVVEFGQAMDVPPELLEKFKQGGVEKRESIAALLDMVYDGLKAVTLRAPDYETLMASLIQAARRLYKTPGQHLTLGQTVEMNRRFLEGYTHYKDHPNVMKFRDDVAKYNRLLRDLGVRDHQASYVYCWRAAQVPAAKKASWHLLGLTIYRLVLLFIWTALALPGVILNGPIFITASIISRRKAKEALAGSMVKVAGRDVLATWKILVALGLTPILYGFYAFLSFVAAYNDGASLPRLIMAPITTLVLLPCVAYAALKFGEAGSDVLKSLRPLVITLIPWQQHHLNKLKSTRLRLANELADIVHEFGPQLYDDFDAQTVMVPSATAPPSSGVPGLWRRKSGVGAVDAQGHLLSHPMTWLDERLFGWSRSAIRSRSLVDKGSSEEAPRVDSSPSETDDEDDDYDTLMSGRATPLLSRRSSYADLRIRKPIGSSGP